MYNFNINFDYYTKKIERLNLTRNYGIINRVIGMVIESRGPAVPIGAICEIELRDNKRLAIESVGFKDNQILFMPLGEMRGVEPGGKIFSLQNTAEVGVSKELTGRILDGMGNPIDNKGIINFENYYPLYAEPLNPMERPRIAEPLDVGVRAINACLTLGKGQRIAIMAGAGVGKSTLLGMIAKNTKADLNVIALIGERGRELMDFIHKDLGPEGLARSVVVVATSDQPPLIRMRGAYLAVSIAEYFRDQGKDVLFMMDSVTRFALAQREVGLAIGEPPTTKGFTPSVFAHLPRLLERAGRKAGKGSITGIYTVLVEGDDLNEPVSDAVRSIVDGHIVLKRSIAHQGHYPAIDVLESISRLMKDISKNDHIDAYKKLINVLATYRRVEDLINLGAYVKGSNAEIDFAIQKIEAIKTFLRQDVNEKITLEESVKQIKGLF
jgi:flagellum-specific ATP synthase